MIAAKTPPPPKEIEVSTLVLLEGHEGYVDVAAWSPLEDVIVTGSSDRQAFLWHIHGHQAPDRVSLEAEDLDSPVSAVAWSEDGEAFALGEDPSPFVHQYPHDKRQHYQNVVKNEEKAIAFGRSSPNSCCFLTYH